jgi:hypothetical protein
MIRPEIWFTAWKSVQEAPLHTLGNTRGRLAALKKLQAQIAKRRTGKKKRF